MKEREDTRIKKKKKSPTLESVGLRDFFWEEDSSRKKQEKESSAFWQEEHFFLFFFFFPAAMREGVRACHQRVSPFPTLVQADLQEERHKN